MSSEIFARKDIETNVERQEKILLVDDDPVLLKLLEIRLASQGYLVSVALNASEAIRYLADDDISVVLSDLRMPGEDGMYLLDYINARYPSLPVVIMSAHGTISEAVCATEKGALGFLTKPIDHDKLYATLKNATSQRFLVSNSHWHEEIIFKSAVMQQLLDQAGRVASKDISVLITGASGTGKELLARAIHKASPRASRPFVAINCGALPEQILESELFGHKKGAFTGAVKDYEGLFMAAQGGTLFLDEIGDMPVALQVKLLRVLQERKLRPIGSTVSVDIDVRVLSATHKNLPSAMQDGLFREDLYYRLCVVSLNLPSLSERQEDIPVLARTVLKQASERFSVTATRFSDEALLRLCQAPWPGNIRQLVNVIEQCVALTQSPVISLSLVNQALMDNSHVLPGLTQAKDEFERDYICRVLSMTNGVVAQAAELSGRNRTDFYKLIKKHQIQVERYKASDAG